MMKFRKDLLLTAFTSLLIALSNVLLYKLALITLGTSGFFEYSLSRRIIATVMPAMMIGFGVSVPRYVALYSGNREQYQLFTGVFMLLVGIGIFFLMISTALRRPLAYALFGDRDYASTIVPITFVMVGSALHAVCFGYYRGRLNMVVANLINILGMIVRPVSSMLLSKGSVESLFLIHGSIIIVISSIVFILSGKAIGFVNLPRNIKHIKEALGYGVRRVPGDFALMALLGLPSIISVHVTGLEEAGMMAFCMTMVTVYGAIYSPVSTLLLPYVAIRSRIEGMEAVKFQSINVVKYSLISSVVLFVIIFIGADWLTYKYLGSEFVKYSWMIKVTAFAGLLFSIYVSLRSVNDAIFSRAVNARSCIHSLVIFCLMNVIVMMLKIGILGILISLLFSLAALAAMTVANFVKAVSVQKVEVGLW